MDEKSTYQNNPQIYGRGGMRILAVAMTLLAALVGWLIYQKMKPVPIQCGDAAAITAYAVEGGGPEAAIQSALEKRGLQVGNIHDAGLRVDATNWDVVSSTTFRLEAGNKRICKIGGEDVLGYPA